MAFIIFPRRAFFSAGAVFFATAVFFAALPVSADAAAVTRSRGRADIIRKGSERGEPIGEGAAIYPGDSVRTKTGAGVELTLDGGAVITLAERTKVTFQSLPDGGAKTRAVVLLSRGRIKARDAARGAEGASGRAGAGLEVQTTNTVVDADGAAVFIFYRGGITGVYAEKGNAARCYHKAFPANAVDILPGTYTLVRNDNPAGAVVPYMEGDYKKLSGGIEFDVPLTP